MHGGMAQNVGPILEMVTEKYLLRSEKEWEARKATNEIFDNILQALKEGDIRTLAKNTARNWDYPIKTIIPWASTYFTEQIIAKAEAEFGEDYWGFLMLGGMSGGGMGMFVNPEKYEVYKGRVWEILKETKEELSDSLPFAMEPVVYDFKINPKGTQARFMRGNEALMPDAYYSLQIAELAQRSREEISYERRAELDVYTASTRGNDKAFRLLRTMVGRLFQVSDASGQESRREQDRLADAIKREYGFDYIQHEQLRKDLQRGRIGLARNRLPAETQIEDVYNDDVVLWNQLEKHEIRGIEALADGKVAMLTLAGGVGSRWTEGGWGDQGTQSLCRNGRQASLIPRNPSRQNCPHSQEKGI